MTAVEAATLAAAVIGAFLALVNTLHTLRKDRLKLRVRPLLCVVGQDLRLAVEVRNESSFDITVEAMAFVIRGGPDETFVPERLGSHGALLPHTLKPRAVLTGFAPVVTVQRENLARVVGVRVYFDGGERKRGSGDALAWYVKNRPAAKNPGGVVQYRAARDGQVVTSPHGVPKAYTHLVARPGDAPGDSS